MPLLIRYPARIRPGSINEDMVQNTDFAPTLLDLAGVAVPTWMDGRSFLPCLEGNTPADWRKAVYYRYWMNFRGYNIPAHYGIRTDRYKLIYYYGLSLGTNGSDDKPGFNPYWELYDLQKDPAEINNLYDKPAYRALVQQLKAELEKLQLSLGDKPVN